MYLEPVGDETLQIIADGEYLINGSERKVEVCTQIQASVEGTVFYPPGTLSKPGTRQCTNHKLTIEVTNEMTVDCGERLLYEGYENVGILNFASGRRPGGGFRGKAKAQEEDIVRRSALYACLESQPKFYQLNREASVAYTDSLIYSPDVPFFRNSYMHLVYLFPLSVVTCAAPNAGALEKGDNAQEILHHRIQIILEAFIRHGHSTIVLGAWGCGVFKNDPEYVAFSFSSWLKNPIFSGCFERVVFAIYDKSSRSQIKQIFEQELLNTRET